MPTTKKISVSKQIAIINYKQTVSSVSGIEAGYIITPYTDSVAGPKFYARILPNVNRVDILGADALTPRGITEATAVAKYAANTAALKTFFGLVNAGEDASANGMAWIKLDAGGVFWDLSVAPFPEGTVFATTATDGVKTDVSDTHKYINFFNPTTGDFDATPVKKAAAEGTDGEVSFYQKYKSAIWWGLAGVVVVVGGILVIANPFHWGKKKKKKDK